MDDLMSGAPEVRAATLALLIVLAEREQDLSADRTIELSSGKKESLEALVHRLAVTPKPLRLELLTSHGRSNLYVSTASGQARLRAPELLSGEFISDLSLAVRIGDRVMRITKEDLKPLFRDYEIPGLGYGLDDPESEFARTHFAPEELDGTSAVMVLGVVRPAFRR